MPGRFTTYTNEAWGPQHAGPHSPAYYVGAHATQPLSLTRTLLLQAYSHSLESLQSPSLEENFHEHMNTIWYFPS